jgi:hypothetical protein
MKILFLTALVGIWALSGAAALPRFRDVRDLWNDVMGMFNPEPYVEDQTEPLVSVDEASTEKSGFNQMTSQETGSSVGGMMEVTSASNIEITSQNPSLELATATHSHTHHWTTKGHGTPSPSPQPTATPPPTPSPPSPPTPHIPLFPPIPHPRPAYDLSPIEPKKYALDLDLEVEGPLHIRANGIATETKEGGLVLQDEVIWDILPLPHHLDREQLEEEEGSFVEGDLLEGKRRKRDTKKSRGQKKKGSKGKKKKDSKKKNKNRKNKKQNKKTMKPKEKKPFQGKIHMQLN